MPGGDSVIVTFQVTVGTPPVGTFQIENQAHVSADNSPDPIYGNFVFNALPFPALVLTKSADPSTYDSVGDVINYSYVVTNNSTTSTLAGPVTVTDDKVIVTCPLGNIAPLASKTCTASHTITQADLDSGSILNTATAHAGGIDSNIDQATVTAIQTKSLSIVKSATPLTYDSVGDAIGYSYVVKNTGNVTLSGPFSVADDKATDEFCPTTATLAPNASILCSASYAITQADLDAGHVTNIASATNGTVTSPTDTETVTAIQNPALLLVKSATLHTDVVGPVDRVDAGDTISYAFAVTNTGNVTLSGVTVTDPLTGLDCFVGTLLPGQTDSLSCSTTYVLSQADVNAGSRVNTATVDAFDPDGEPVTDSDTATVPLPKQASVDAGEVGDGALRCGGAGWPCGCGRFDLVRLRGDEYGQCDADGDHGERSVAAGAVVHDRDVGAGPDGHELLGVVHAAAVRCRCR